MKKYLILAVTVFFSALFAGQIGPWSHFKAITSDFTVNLEDTLLITPGTEIRFAPNIKFNIFGVVFANGTSTAPITFSALSPTNPTWGGIFISNSTPGKVSVFNYSSFSKINTSGDGAMYIGNSNVNFNFCNFANNHSDLKGGAIYAMAGSLNFNSCQFKDNSADMGGAVYIHNYSTVSPSVIYIQNCRFLSNTAMNGGGLYIEDYDGAMFNMILIVVNSGFFFNKANGCGGGLFLNCLSHIDFTLKKTKIQYNESMTSGGGIYAVYNDLYSQDVLGQEYSNLLITQNISEIEGAGVWFNSGMTTNSSAFTFINTTITYNKIRQEIIPKTVGGAGIYIYSEGNYPVIRNSIIWGNNEDQFMINDPGGPDPDAVFHYCNVQGAFTGIDGLDSIPRFVRPPLLAGDWSSTPERYNYHLLISSPSIDAGDPETPCTERNSTRVNQGAYGNTAEARLSLDGADVLPIDTGTNINVGDYGVTVLDFQNAATSFNFSKISMGSGAELHLKNLSNFAIIGIDTLLTNGIAKFDDERVVIQPDYSSDVSVPQELKVTNLIDLYGADISNIKLNIYSTGKSNPEVNINNTTMYSSSYRDEYGISITDASTVNIENCSIDNFAGGIEVNNVLSTENKIANNIVNFDPDIITKVGQQIGIDISGSQIDVEDNDIENGDIGIQMKSSSGRISNNTVNFTADAASKLLDGRIGINILQDSDVEIIDNEFWAQDSTSYKISGINIDSSRAKISYNKINFAEAGITDIRNGVVLNNALDTTYIYNNTIYNPRNGIDNTPSAATVNIINNIMWHGGSREATISDKTNLVFYNNDIENIPVGFTGSGNISSDPLCIDPSTNELVLSTTPAQSPCINAGLIVTDFHIADSTYYGAVPDIGALEYYEIYIAGPSNVTVGATDSTFIFGWDAVTGASYYYIYSSDDPYGTFLVEDSVYTTSWETDLTSVKKFFYITAQMESKAFFTGSKPTADKPKNFNSVNDDPAVVVTKKKIRIKRSNSDK